MDMNTQPGADLITALQNTSMLAAIRIKRLGLGRADKNAGKEVAVQHNARQDATKLVVNRLAGADEHHNAIASLQNTARNAFNELTLSWDGDGWRLLPNDNFPRVVQALQPILEEMKRLKDAMIADVDNIILRARQGVGTLAVAPPDREEILNGYDMKLEFQPLPDGSRFKGLPQATMNALSRHIEARARGAWEQAQSDATGRVATALSYMVERLTLYQERMDAIAAGKDVGRVGVFNDSLVENIKQLAELLPAFNVANDPRLAELADKLAALAGTVDGNTLRKEQSAREKAIAQAKDMLDVLAVWKVK